LRRRALLWYVTRLGEHADPRGFWDSCAAGTGVPGGARRLQPDPQAQLLDFSTLSADDHHALLWWAHEAGASAKGKLLAAMPICRAVEVAQGKRLVRYDLDARHVRIEMEGSRIVLREAGEALELGRHLDEQSRRVFGAELKKRLQY